MTGMAVPRWTIIIPIKRLPLGKSRLRGAADDDLVLAIAADTVAAAGAAQGVASVLVVTGDPVVAGACGAAGAQVVADPGTGLNAAIRHGEAHASTVGHRGALLADLPALRHAELAAALRAAAGMSPPRRAFVADHTGTGSTLLVAPPGVPLAPRFGGGSAAAHAGSGAHPLSGDWPSLRLDVDTPADLDAATALGLGARTRAALARGPLAGSATGHGDPPSADPPAVHRWAATPPPTGKVDSMQGTVARFDPQRRDGAVLLDDGTELEFPAAAFNASGLRLLRFGQRVRLETGDGDRITRIALVTM
jgi:2-phospho-L-lactate guanylyltransferase